MNRESLMQQRYTQLPDLLYQVIQPCKVDDPSLLLFNKELASQLDLPEQLLGDDAADYLSGNTLIAPELSVALGYSGHQFGHYNPQLGDGRAHMLGQLNGFDWQLKGSGRTQYSRSGDGGCALGPAIREYIMSEAMHVLGVPTMRTLAVTTTGEKVYRHQPEMGAVVNRIGKCHLRIGSFQYAYALDVVKEMADFAIEQLCPSAKQDANPYLTLYRTVQNNAITMLVHWYRVGFIHGVMNTDNIALSGETFDFGPCAMLGSYKLDQVYSSIDQQGRYAFGNQKAIMQWNLARFAETLITLMPGSDEQAIALLNAEIHQFSTNFQDVYDQMCAHKLGIEQSEHPLVLTFFDLLKTHQWDYTQIFNQLYDWLAGVEIDLPEALTDWAEQWRTTIDQEKALSLMKITNPRAIPRNHEVEALIALTTDDTTDLQHHVDRYLDYLSHGQADDTTWGNLNAEFDHNYQTFCGT